MSTTLDSWLRAEVAVRFSRPPPLNTTRGT
jgi:hypothetical protein